MKIYSISFPPRSESIPKIYDYISGTNERSTILVTELLGDNLQNIFLKAKAFSITTIMEVGLQVVSEKLHNFN